MLYCVIAPQRRLTPSSPEQQPATNDDDEDDRGDDDDGTTTTTPREVLLHEVASIKNPVHGDLLRHKGLVDGTCLARCSYDSQWLQHVLAIRVICNPFTFHDL